MTPGAYWTHLLKCISRCIQSWWKLSCPFHTNTLQILKVLWVPSINSWFLPCFIWIQVRWLAAILAALWTEGLWIRRAVIWRVLRVSSTFRNMFTLVTCSVRISPAACHDNLKHTSGPSGPSGLSAPSEVSLSKTLCSEIWMTEVGGMLKLCAGEAEWAQWGPVHGRCWTIWYYLHEGTGCDGFPSLTNQLFIPVSDCK